MANKVVRIRSWQEEHGDYRCGGTVVMHEKYYACSNCGSSVGFDAKFCPRCGDSLKGVVDTRKKEIKKKITKYKTERTKLIKSVTPESFDSITEKVKEIDKNIDFYEVGLYRWENYSSGSLPDVLDEL